MANYIEISRDGGATWKKVSVFIEGDTVNAEPVAPALVEEDLSGNVVESVGVAKYHWHYIIKIWAAPPDSSYATAQWILEMFATLGKIRVKSLGSGMVGECSITNRGAPNKRSITIDHNTLFSFDLDLLGVML
jgi:hypothetical protein